MHLGHLAPATKRFFTLTSANFINLLLSNYHRIIFQLKSILPQSHAIDPIVIEFDFASRLKLTSEISSVAINS
ncbi:protein of unknown function [Shewanella benthica]|uniref:Uncharacterized protein n=1 Tax=Shewanella benthica TaxID=43661 RepID=A0A330M269_9GAMM|nr:protein of unknown function [Shewanella benthica]